MVDLLDLAHALLASPKSAPKIDGILDEPLVKQEVDKPRVINRDHDVPYLAGSSKAGGTTYIDHRVPTEIKVGDKMMDPAKYLNIHEQTEHALMTTGGLPYHKAHAIATDKEKAAVQANGFDWDKYEEVMDGYVNETEHEKLENPPKDLYTKPYPHKESEFIKHKAAHEMIRDHGAMVAALVKPRAV